MSDSDNYFSDSDKSNKEVQSENEEEEELSEYEMDDETRMIIYNAMKRRAEEDKNFYDDLNSVEKPVKKKERIRKVKTKKYIDLIQVDNNVVEEKPKKWMSRRLADKKKELGIKDDNSKRTVQRRTFNPRLPVPTKDTFKRKVDFNEVNITDEEFPSLNINV